jgi:hypothetical protein
MVEAAGGRLQECSLQPGAWQEFEGAVQQLAEARERSVGSFDSFISHLRANKFEVFLDAANIAYFNTQWVPSDNAVAFQWLQVKYLYSEVQRLYPDKRALVIVHFHRTAKRFIDSPEVEEFLAMLKVRLSMLDCQNAAHRLRICSHASQLPASVSVRPTLLCSRLPLLHMYAFHMSQLCATALA